MTAIIPEKVAATLEGDFVVFLIGMRINKFFAFNQWFPVARAMGPMVDELNRKPELGLLHSRIHFGLPNILVVQYWRGFDHLRAYATGGEHSHLKAWRNFNKAIAANAGNEGVGIWHETYLVKAGAYETLYTNMPPYGLGAAGKLVPAKGRMQSAAGRVGRTDGSDRPEGVS
jgi:hypothetical protein